VLSKELNERLTRIGPGTPAGDLYRRYWMPVAATSQLVGPSRIRVRILGEDLVLFRDGSGTLGLVGEQCPHRGCSLLPGIPEQRGLRCAYHGWLFSETGEVLEQPAEPAESVFRNRVRAKAYPVEELGGLVFAYMGPDPAPLLPRFDLFVEPGGLRHIGVTHLPVNWLQIMENSLDPVHFEWLHGHYGNHVFASKGMPQTTNTTAKHIKIAFDRFEYGIIKRRLVEGRDETADEWAIGHPIVFPNMLRLGLGPGVSAFQIRVPVDDTNTLIWWYTFFHRPDKNAQQESVPVFELPSKTEDGETITDTIDGQDMMVWVSQGPVYDRSTEHLGTSDRGVVAYRRMLQEEMAHVAEGKDPVGVVRDPSINDSISLPHERHVHFSGGPSYRDHLMRTSGMRYSPLQETILEFMLEEAVEPSEAP
jgi:5,5'-dehydrodivanillate O-demethylase